MLLNKYIEKISNSIGSVNIVNNNIKSKTPKKCSNKMVINESTNQGLSETYDKNGAKKIKIRNLNSNEIALIIKANCTTNDYCNNSNNNFKTSEHTKNQTLMDSLISTALEELRSTLMFYSYVFFFFVICSVSL